MGVVPAASMKYSRPFLHFIRNCTRRTEGAPLLAPGRVAKGRNHGNKKAQPSARVAAAMAILKKTLPDLASIEHTGYGPRPFAVIPEAIETAAEWEVKFKPKTEH